MGSRGLTLAASPAPSPGASDRSASPGASRAPDRSPSPDASDRSGSPDASRSPDPLPSSLPSLDLAGPVVDVAPTLLGARLVHGDVVVRLTEVEAYAGESDPGSHAFRRRTARTEVMFGRAGVAYVYFSYGMHWCMNVVTGAEGSASAVLLRAGEVVGGIESARSRRPGARDRDLARGPARLTRALGLDGSFGGTDLLDPRAPLRLLPPAVPADPAGVLAGPRVGVAGLGAPTPWRFWLAGDPTVSPYRAAAPRRRPRPR